MFCVDSNLSGKYTNHSVVNRVTKNAFLATKYYFNSKNYIKIKIKKKNIISAKVKLFDKVRQCYLCWLCYMLIDPLRIILPVQHGAFRKLIENTIYSNNKEFKIYPSVSEIILG